MPRSRQVIGYPAPLLIGLAIGTAVVSYLVTLGVATNSHSSLGTVVGDSLLLGAVSVAVLIAASSWMWLQDAGELAIANGLLYWRIPLDEVERFDSRSGLRLITKSGRVIKPIAYGRSLLGEFTGYRRSQRAIRRYDALIRDLSGTVPLEVHRATTSRHKLEHRLRLPSLIIGLGCWLGYFVTGLLIYVLR